MTLFRSTTITDISSCFARRERPYICVYITYEPMCRIHICTFINVVCTYIHVHMHKYVLNIYISVESIYICVCITYEPMFRLPMCTFTNVVCTYIHVHMHKYVLNIYIPVESISACQDLNGLQVLPGEALHLRAPSMMAYICTCIFRCIYMCMRVTVCIYKYIIYYILYIYKYIHIHAHLRIYT